VSLNRLKSQFEKQISETITGKEKLLGVGVANWDAYRYEQGIIRGLNMALDQFDQAYKKLLEDDEEEE
jgi:hypothetical protein